MFARLKFHLRRILVSLWFRPALYAMGAALTLALTPLVEPFLPWAWTELIANETNEAVLTILASTLLAVAIFSLSAMVAALSSASQSATPRARPLLVEDAAAQNAISTFIGAFLFSLLGVIGTLLNLFSPVGRVILFVLTLVLVLIVVATLIRWLQRLSNLGDVMEAVRRVEQAAVAGLRDAGPPQRVDATEAVDLTVCEALYARTPGFVQVISRDDLEDTCRRLGFKARLCVREGDFADARAPLLRTERALDEEDQEALRAAFQIGDARTFAHDARLGLIVLSEIASKALSPGVNDPGTAVGAARAAQRALDGWGRPSQEAETPKARHWLAGDPLDPDEAMSCAFGPIAFDGAGRPELVLTLLDSYAGLAAVQPFFFEAPARRLAAELMVRMEEDMPHEADRALVRARYIALGFA